MVSMGIGWVLGGRPLFLLTSEDSSIIVVFLPTGVSIFEISVVAFSANLPLDFLGVDSSSNVSSLIISSVGAAESLRLRPVFTGEPVWKCQLTPLTVRALVLKGAGRPNYFKVRQLYNKLCTLLYANFWKTSLKILSNYDLAKQPIIADSTWFKSNDICKAHFL